MNIPAGKKGPPGLNDAQRARLLELEIDARVGLQAPAEKWELGQLYGRADDRDIADVNEDLRAYFDGLRADRREG